MLADDDEYLLIGLTDGPHPTQGVPVVGVAKVDEIVSDRARRVANEILLAANAERPVEPA